MDYRRFGNKLVIRLNRGEEIVTSLVDIFKKEDIRAGYFTGLGAIDQLTMAIFDKDKKEYIDSTYEEPLEVTALVGNVSTMDDQVYTHMHITCGRGDGTALAGHLKKAVISMTAEIFVEVIDGKIDRSFDEETGINLIKF